MNKENLGTLHQTLKNQTMSLHEKAHQIPYIKNLLNNDVSLVSYVGHLRALAIIYGTLEHQLNNLNQSIFKDILEDYSPKLPLILKDLEYFNANSVKDIIPSVSIALQLADKILLYTEQSPYKLLGFLYTLDGSLNGGFVFKKHISEIFDLSDDNGVLYFSVFDEPFKMFWKNFISNLNTKILDSQIKDEIVSASSEIFNGLLNIYECLYPINEKLLGNHITSLNPEAGNHPIPSNPIEIQAAIKSGLKCWEEFPFYERRYGERGRRFAVSDSAWLVTLCELSAELAISQANWLAKYLAHIGMPTITMEIQLEYLYQELAKEIPANESKYRVLLLASENLREQRIKQIDGELFEKSNVIFLEFCNHFQTTDEQMNNIGKLIASSIADKKNGIEESYLNFKAWLTNEEQFSANWIEAVEKTYLEIENKFHG